MTKKEILSPSAEYALRQEFVEQMRREARRFGAIERVRSRRQWQIAKQLLAEWKAGEYEGELTKDEFYCEASRVICDELGYAAVSTTGETVKVWCEVFAQFENAPTSLKEQLPFQYFRNARTLANAGKVAVPMAAIATALDHKLTAEEMLNWYSDPAQMDARILEWRKCNPEYLWSLGNILFELNGNRAQVEFHAAEIQRLVEEDRK